MKKYIYFILTALVLFFIQSCKERVPPTVKKVVTVSCRECNKIISSDTTTIPLPDRYKNQKSPPEYLHESKKILCKECAKVDAVFDIPNLLKMRIGKIKAKLGKPNSEYKATSAQIKLDPNFPSTVEYQKGTTNIQIDYNSNGKVLLIFISDEKPGRTQYQILQLGNLQASSEDYSVRIQRWAKPTKGSAEIAGIEVKPK